MATTSNMNRAGLLQRLTALKGGSARKAFPPLILELDNLGLARMPVAQRVKALRTLKTPVLGALRALSRIGSQQSAPPNGATEAMALEQRLMMLMCKRLRQALAELHRDQDQRQGKYQSHWEWVVEYLLIFHERQAVYSIESGRPPPAGTWFDLHDLFVQFVILGTIKVGQRAAGEDALDVEQGYKRILLLGLLDRLADRRIRLEVVSPQLEYWAWETRLLDPMQAVGRDGQFVVETAKDGPPRHIDGILTEPFRGWTLQLPPAFEELLSEPC